MKNIAVILFLAISVNAYSGTDWSGSTTISTLYPHQSGLQFIINSPALSSYSTCENGKRFRLDQNADDYDVMVSLLTTAFVTGKKINIAIDADTLASCSPIILKFKLYN